MYHTMANNEEIVLKMFIQPGNEKLREFYVNKVAIHNAGIYSPFAAAGFEFNIKWSGHDMEARIMVSRQTFHLGIQCAMYAYRQYTPPPSGNGYAFWSGFSHPKLSDGSLNTDVTIVEIPQSYYLYTKSTWNVEDSMGSYRKTDRLDVPTNFKSIANYVGTIDSGYRGEITADIGNGTEKYRKDYNFKICHHSLSAFKIVIVNTMEELGMPVNNIN